MADRMLRHGEHIELVASVQKLMRTFLVDMANKVERDINEIMGHGITI